MLVASHYMLESNRAGRAKLICVMPSLFLARQFCESRAGVPLKFVETLPGYWEAEAHEGAYSIRLYPVVLPEVETEDAPVLLERRMTERGFE